MSHGEDSEDYSAWVRHCRRCPDCRSELFILEALREDAEGKRVHLPRESVAKLSAIAQARYGGRRRRRPLRLLWGFTWKVSALAAMVVFLLHVVPMDFGHDPVAPVAPRESASPSLARVVESEFTGLGAMESEVVALSPGEYSYQHRMAASHGTEMDLGMSEWMDILPGQSFERQIRDSRRRVSVQRQRMEDLIDCDLRGY